MSNASYSLPAEMAFLENSTAWFDDVQEAGRPVPSPPIPDLAAKPSETLNVRALDLETGEVRESVDIIYARPAENESARRAYLVGDEIKRETKLRVVHVWKMCRLVQPSTHPEQETDWEIEKDSIMVECFLWGEHAISLPERKFAHHLNDARAEIAALQYVAHKVGTHPNLPVVLDVLQDETQWLVFTPFVATEDLFSLLQKSIFNETTARFWFRQVLKAVVKLHRAGICHRSLGLESVLLQEGKDVALLSNFEFSCRIPYAEDRLEDPMRRLIVRSEEVCGRPYYIAPEIWKFAPAFDGYAVDIWALGAMLFVMLIGVDPWKRARQEDDQYSTLILTAGKLEEKLNQENVSPLAISLLKRLLEDDPRDRITLYELRHHPWVLDELRHP